MEIFCLGHLEYDCTPWNRARNIFVKKNSLPIVKNMKAYMLHVLKTYTHI